jgi:hypothetical protein
MPILFLNQTLFLNKRDPEEKPVEFQDYYNVHRVHKALNLKTPEEAAGKKMRELRAIYGWCRS